MASQSKPQKGQVSGILLMIVGLLAGFIGGYAISHQGAPSTGFSPNAAAGASTCQFELDLEDQPIIAGFKCPGQDCPNHLSVCHCDMAHQIKQRIRNMLDGGEPAENIRALIQREYNL